MSACYRERHDNTQIYNVRQAELSDWLRLPALHVILGDMYGLYFSNPVSYGKQQVEGL